MALVIYDELKHAMEEKDKAAEVNATSRSQIYLEGTKPPQLLSELSFLSLHDMWLPACR